MATMKQETLAVLDYIKKNPGSNVNQIADALTAKATKAEVSSALFSLWQGRYVTRAKGEAKNASGFPLFDYTFKTEKPRRRKAHAKRRRSYRPRVKLQRTEIIPPSAIPMVGSVEVLLAFNGSKETIVLTIERAKELSEQLKSLGL